MLSDSDDDLPLSSRANGTVAQPKVQQPSNFASGAEVPKKVEVPTTADVPKKTDVDLSKPSVAVTAKPAGEAGPSDSVKLQVPSSKPSVPTNGGFSRDRFAGQTKASGGSSGGDAVARVNNIVPKPKTEQTNGAAVQKTEVSKPSVPSASNTAVSQPKPHVSKVPGDKPKLSSGQAGSKVPSAEQNGVAKPSGISKPNQGQAGSSAPKPSNTAQGSKLSKDGTKVARPENGSVRPDAPKPKADPSKQLQKGGSVTNAAPKPTVKRIIEDDSDSEDDLPLNKRVKASTGQSLLKPKVKQTGSKKGDGPTKKRKSAVETNAERQAKKSKTDDKKWTDLHHAGVLFPPDYLAHGVKMLYDGKPVDLTPEQEEVASMYGVMIETDYAKKKQFNDNFWAAFKDVLGKGHVIKSLDKCDFRPMYEHFMAEREAKKLLPKDEKLRLKEEKDAAEAKYKTALVDGRKEGVGNFRVEPPGLFRGRGEHPKMGQYKRRIYPRDITINIGRNQPIPEHPYAGQKWKEIRHDNTVTWLAFWKDPISAKDFKYVWLAANSSFKSDSDLAKYEKARKLKSYVDGIRERYQKDWKSDDTFKQQMGVALYFIDKLALRAGHEKDEDEADTVGCCTLKVENVEVMDDPANHIKFDFLGKDSIRYENQVEVDPRVWKLVKRFCGRTSNGKSKSGDDQLFETLNATDLNNSLKDLMEGLSVKVFRTYNASITLDRLLYKDSTSETLEEKKADYDRANKEVAILCNHQRAVPKGHSDQMERLADKLKTLQDELDALTLELKVVQGKVAPSKLKSPLKKSSTEDQVKNRIVKKKEQLAKLQVQSRSKEDLKTVALGTSKINYLDPRITIAWCKRQEVPIEKIFNKSLLSKFHWAMDADPDFKF